MTIQGLIGTHITGTPDPPTSEERPLNWRQGILMRFPNGHAPLVALTAAMKKKTTDDPEYRWWEREVSNLRLELAADINASVTTITFVADPDGFEAANQLKVGDIIYAEDSGELMRVITWTSNVSIEVTRGFAGSTAAAIALATDNPKFFLVGSAYPEGSEHPESVRYRPTKEYNYTQIFRNSLKATRTAMQTRLRTVDEIRDAKTQALLYHSIAMEYGYIFGGRSEALSGGQPLRTTGGIISFIPASQNIDKLGVAYDMSEFESDMLEVFRWGSQEKMCFCGNRAMLAFNQMARLNSSLEITPAQKEFGMDVRRFFTPGGTLVLKTHPLFNQITSDIGGSPAYRSLDAWALILDMAQLTYRPLKNSDTQYLPDRQNNGMDGLESEYLTEAGLEVNHGKNHYLIKGLVAGAAG